MKKNNIFIVVVVLLFVFITLIGLFTVITRTKDLRSRAQGGDFSVILTPRDQILNAGSEKEAILTLDNRTNKKVVGVNLGIMFNPRVLQITDITTNAGNDKSFTDDFSPSINTQLGEARIVLFADKNNNDLPTSSAILLASIKFKALSGGKSDLFINEKYEIIAFSDETEDYKKSLTDTNLGIWQVPGQGVTLVPTRPDSTPIPTVTATPTPIPKGNVQLNLALQLQGVLSQPPEDFNSLKLKVSINPEDYSQLREKTIEVSADDQAIWTGEAVFENVYVDIKYQITLKSVKHLSVTLEDVLLEEGENEIDLTDQTILSGDINGDDIINSYDLSFIRNNIFSEEEVLLVRADLNFDGIINAVDFSLAISGLKEQE